MNIWDVLIIILVAGLILFALKLARGRKAKGGCGCGCSDCPQKKSCPSRNNPED